MKKLRRLLKSQEAVGDQKVSLTDEVEDEISRGTESPLPITRIKGKPNDRVSEPKLSSSTKQLISTDKLTEKLLETKLATLVTPSEPCCLSKGSAGPYERLDGDSTMPPASKTSELATSPAAESGHLRVSLEPVRAKIISYLVLLRKMTARHP
jgi:hypothetical protein